MITMPQSAANWHNTHTYVDHTHSLTHLHQHSYNQRQLSYYIIRNQILFWRYLTEGEQTGVPVENPWQPAR